jgi:Asp-tRNA(Asn)/Glu-tRNA(Gln) amidotransferase A subunit family amidase
VGRKPTARRQARRQHPSARATVTAPFDVTDHTARSILCGMSERRPIGLIVVGRHFDDATACWSCLPAATLTTPDGGGLGV